jgi:hypothetical protein
MIRFQGWSVLTGMLLVVATGCADRESPELGSQNTATSTDHDSGTSDQGQDPDGDDAGSTQTKPTPDAGPNTAAPICSSSFGSALTTEFGRIDGTLVGIARPQDSHCAQPNKTHVALDVEINGAAYRFLVNVQSDSGSPDVYFLETNHTLAGPAWSEGWHTASVESIYLDYASYFDLHTADFASAYAIDDLTEKVVSDLTLGEKISVYATAYGPDGGHDIHKESAFGNDGAVVVGPDTESPKWLLFRFDDSPAF